jgi:hypothetical protein
MHTMTKQKSTVQKVDKQKAQPTTAIAAIEVKPSRCSLQSVTFTHQLLQLTGLGSVTSQCHACPRKPTHSVGYEVCCIVGARGVKRRTTVVDAA